MNRKRSALLAGLSGLALMAVLAALFVLLVRPRLEAIDAAERKACLQAARGRVQSALTSRIHDLARLTEDYACWDDMYRFALHGKESFADTNFDPETLHSLGLSGVLLMGPAGDIRFHVEYDERLGSIVDRTRPLALLNHIQTNRHGVNQGYVDEGDFGVSVYAAKPILHNDKRGPAAGMLVMIRPLSDKELSEVSSATGCRLSWRPLFPRRGHKSDLEELSELVLHRYDGVPIGPLHFSVDLCELARTQADRQAVLSMSAALAFAAIGSLAVLGMIGISLYPGFRPATSNIALTSRISKKLLPVSCCLIAGLGGAFTVAHWVEKWVAHQAKSEFSRRVELVRQRVDATILAGHERAGAIRGFFEGSEFVRRDEFINFCNAVTHGDGLAPVDLWITADPPIAPHETLNRMSDGRLELQFAHPPERMEQIVLTAETCEALLASLNVRGLAPVYVSELMSIGDKEHEPAIWFIAPVTRMSDDHVVSGQSGPTRGFAVSAWTERKLLTRALAGVDTKGFEVSLVHIGGLWDTRSKSDAKSHTSFMATEPLTELPGEWCIKVTARSGFHGNVLGWLRHGVFGVGVMLTALMAAYIASLLHREEETTRLVGIRTQELDEAKRVAEESKTKAMELNSTLMNNLAEQIHLGQELSAAKLEAEEANRAKSTFLANMSHEIRTPMTAILGFAENLLDAGLTEAERVDAVYTIQRNSTHLLQIINDILDVSKIEAGKLEVERIPCSPREILDDVVSLMRVRAQEAGLTLDLEFVGLIPHRIITDPTRFRQILLNLVGNAIKFTETGGVRIVVSLAHEQQWFNKTTATHALYDDDVSGRDETGSHALNQTDSTETGPWLRFDVIDTGIGLSDEQLAQLFKPFSQGDASTTRKFGGTGLGLIISRKLSSLLGGDIVITSTPGSGTTVTGAVVTGPLETDTPMYDSATGRTIPKLTEEKGAEGLQRKADLRTEGKVLLVEDNPDSARLIAFVLRRAGLTVQTAENGLEGKNLTLEAWREGHPFDVILMDMQMPIKDGYTATAELRGAGYEGPVIALTAHAMSTDREKCEAVGCDDYAVKPVDRTKLLTQISYWIEEAKHRLVTD